MVICLNTRLVQRCALGAVLLLFGGVTSYAQQAAPSDQSPTSNIPKVGRGAIPPKDLDLIVASQLQAEQALGYIVQHVPRAPRPACSANQAKFDWNALKKVTSAQNQGGCGDCWAFGAIAAYEASYLIENNLTAIAPNTANASEQEALDCVWATYTCNGGWHDKVFDYFIKPGETSRPIYPYTGIKATCKSGSSPEQYLARTWSFVDGAKIPSHAAIKQAICDHGPVVAAVKADKWDDYVEAGGGKSVFAYSTANPNWATDFPNGVFRGGDLSQLDLTMSNMKPGQIDHDVLIVGWDDTLLGPNGKHGAWIIKNSWGPDWGEVGFGKIPYDTQNLGFNAAWVTATNAPWIAAQSARPPGSIAPGLAAVLHSTELTKVLESARAVSAAFQAEKSMIMQHAE